MNTVCRLAIALVLATAAGSVVHAQPATAEPSTVRRPASNETGTAPRPRRVLVLYWYPSDNPVTIAFDRQLQISLKRQSGVEIERYAEYFESGRFPGESQARIMRDYLHQ